MLSIFSIKLEFLAGLETLRSCQQIIPSQCVNIETSGEKRSRHSPLTLLTGGRLSQSMIHWVTIALLMIPPNKIGDITAKCHQEKWSTKSVMIFHYFLIPFQVLDNFRKYD